MMVSFSHMKCTNAELNDGNGHPVLQLSCSSQPENIRQQLADCRASAHLKARRSPRFLVYQLDCGHVHHASVAQAKWEWQKNQKESCALKMATAHEMDWNGLRWQDAPSLLWFTTRCYNRRWLPPSPFSAKKTFNGRPFWDKVLYFRHLCIKLPADSNVDEWQVCISLELCQRQWLKPNNIRRFPKSLVPRNHPNFDHVRSETTVLSVIPIRRMALPVQRECML